ncbi:LuxR C-terminal-related transcriptional regulator [Microbacterium sp. WCS2018Hpa-9]|uniref:helix-turn-helix transcriptional regulator n=1 Tax=Microbacterium sp. WCS2018Hpa-9 TaxID=3073635 RepID=UPI00288A2ABD|nr:LuxR C-terminal-related transcriptional regulator [Microbacterium sp. WCS2018Hpa-9]
MRKRDLMVVGREESLAAAVDLIQAGVSIDVVGSRGSGRSAFLQALRTRVEQDEWTVVSVRGIASLRQHPLAALHLAGIGATNGQRPGPNLHETADSLRQALRASRSVLFLDDWDDLDESSWGVAESVRREYGVPIVLSRLQGLRARHTPSGLPASTLEPSYVIDMTPLRFEELETALEKYLSHPIEASTMSRVFAKSGGNIGLALSLVDATVREKRLVLRGGEWTATRDLWSSGLRAVLEAHLESLDDVTRDALEIIAIVGVADIDTASQLVDWGTLELLEERRMITFIPSGDRQLVAVMPPLLVEFFRHEPLTARRTRLTSQIVRQLSTPESVWSVLTDQQSSPTASGGQDALFVRLLQERARARRIVTAAEWEANPTAASAVRYIRALMHTHTAKVRDVIADVLSSPAARTGDDASRAEFAVLKAEWTAYVDDDLQRAVAQLQDESQTVGVHAGMLRAAEVQLLANLDTVPADFGNRLEVSDELPVTVKLMMLETQMSVLVSLGRFTDALRVFGLIEALETEEQRHNPRVLLGMALFGQGDPSAALDVLQRGFDEAHGYLDIDAVRAFGTAAALCHLAAGDHAAVDDLLEVIFSAGEPSPLPPGVQLSLLAVAAVVAIRRGQVTTGERLAADLEQLGAEDGPLPGQSKAWPQVQLLAFDGNTEKAAELLARSGEALWNRGARMAGLTALLSAVELDPTPTRLAVAMAHAKDLPEAAGLAAQASFVSALVQGDPLAMLTVADELDVRGLTGTALSACRFARAWFAENGDESGQQRAVEREEQIRARHAGRHYDLARFGATAVTLTDREKEVGRLAASGLSNAEIASRLVLSVRTVESHMHRIMRKLDVSNRRGLRRHAEALT